MKKQTVLITVGIALLALFSYDYWTMRQELAQANKVARFAANKAASIQSAIERQGIPID